MSSFLLALKQKLRRIHTTRNRVAHETARAIQMKDLTEEGCGDAAALPNMLMYLGAEAARMSNSSKGPNWNHRGL